MDKIILKRANFLLNNKEDQNLFNEWVNIIGTFKNVSIIDGLKKFNINEASILTCFGEDFLNKVKDISVKKMSLEDLFLLSLDKNLLSSEKHYEFETFIEKTFSKEYMNSIKNSSFYSDFLKTVFYPSIESSDLISYIGIDKDKKLKDLLFDLSEEILTKNIFDSHLIFFLPSENKMSLEKIISALVFTAKLQKIDILTTIKTILFILSKSEQCCLKFNTKLDSSSQIALPSFIMESFLIPKMIKEDPLSPLTKIFSLEKNLFPVNNSSDLLKLTHQQFLSCI